MFSCLNEPTKQMLTGNILLIVCCLFYLAWWLLDFRPTGAVKGIRSGWLLIPALLFGVLAVVRIVGGSGAGESSALILPRGWIAAGGIAAYLLLLAVTSLLLHRQVTTELFLIVGWAALVCAELDALCGMGVLTGGAALLLLILTVLAAAVSLVCYLLYYGLDPVRGYIDGCVPLILVAVMMAVITLAALRG